MTHPARLLDNVVHERARLGILAVLNDVRQADFAHLRDVLELTDGNLSRHVQVLEGAGFVKVRRTFEGRRRRTWISATKAGRRAFADELAALRQIIAAAEHTDSRLSRSADISLQRGGHAS